MLPLSGNVQAGDHSCMRSKSPAFPKSASGCQRVPPRTASPCRSCQRSESGGGIGLAPLRGTTASYLFAGVELTRSCCIIYPVSFHQGTALSPSLLRGRGSKPAGHTHPSPPSFPGRAPPTSATGKERKERSSSSLPPYRGTPRPTPVPGAPHPAPRLTLILSTAASSFSCSTSRCMVLRLPPDDIAKPRRRRRGRRGAIPSGSAPFPPPRGGAGGGAAPPAAPADRPGSRPDSAARCWLPETLGGPETCGLQHGRKKQKGRKGNKK